MRMPSWNVRMCHRRHLVSSGVVPVRQIAKRRRTLLVGKAGRFRRRMIAVCPTNRIRMGDAGVAFGILV